MTNEANPNEAALIDLPEFLTTTGTLSTAERRVLIDQARLLIEGFYVHLPLKRAMHAVDPVQRLKLLDDRLDDYPDEIEFHRALQRIFIELRDLHTNYVLPRPFSEMTALLPFVVEEYFQGGTAKHVVTQTFGSFDKPSFGPGVHVTHWNGIPIERAVYRIAQREAGSNSAARHARGLQRLTLRPLGMSLPPDEEWVDVTYQHDGGTDEVRVPWRVHKPDPAPVGIDVNDASSVEARSLGVDDLTEATNRAKRLFFVKGGLELERRHQSAKSKSLSGAVGDLGNQANETSIFPDVLQFRTVQTSVADFGYLRIRSFNVSNADLFIDEVTRILGLLPQNGLILDVRDNGGGLIMASERLLQLFTDRKVEAERLAFINTPETRDLIRRVSWLDEWKRSADLAVTTGEPFTQGFPVESPSLTNGVGRKYAGPVVLVTSALCYSATDILAAGFKDNQIGKILGIDDNTGAGGANVWTHGLLSNLHPGAESPFEPLPNGASMRVSIRRTLRVGESHGLPLEDLGVVPDERHQLTLDDLLHDNRDLIEKAAQILGS